jgi:hypothetical protein
MDRLVIELVGALPESGKYGVIADAETEIAQWIEAFNARNKMSVVATVRAVRPGKKSAGTAPNTNGAAANDVRVSSSEAGHG